jgi:hypothetical protein
MSCPALSRLCPVAQQQADSSRIGISIGSRKKQQPGLGVRARAAAPAAAGRGLLLAGSLPGCSRLKAVDYSSRQYERLVGARETMAVRYLAEIARRS